MFDYKTYWDNRYKSGGNSGKGSYDENAIYKANYINNLIKQYKVKTTVEIGCGDGNNLSMYDCKSYVGLDVSQQAVDNCKKKFLNSKTKHFELYDPYYTKQADMSLCLDVTYHIFPIEERKKTIIHTIQLAKKIAVFYSFPKPNGHVQHINDYNFEEYIKSIGYDVYKEEELLPPESQSRFYIITK